MSLMYKQAARLKLRFKTPRGLISVEDLCDLPLTSSVNISLDGLAKAVNKELKLSEEESFVSAPSSKDSTNQLRLDILKDIIADKIAANTVKREAVAKAAHKQLLLQRKATLESEAFNGLTAEEVEAELAKL